MDVNGEVENLNASGHKEASDGIAGASFGNIRLRWVRMAAACGSRTWVQILSSLDHTRITFLGIVWFQCSKRSDIIVKKPEAPVNEKVVSRGLFRASPHMCFHVPACHKRVLSMEVVGGPDHHIHGPWMGPNTTAPRRT